MADTDFLPDRKALVAVKPCGCMAAATVTGRQSELAEFVGDHVGYDLATWPIEKVRQHPFECDDCALATSKQEAADDA